MSIDRARIHGSLVGKRTALDALAVSGAVAPGRVPLNDSIANCVTVRAAGYGCRGPHGATTLQRTPTSRKRTASRPSRSVCGASRR